MTSLGFMAELAQGSSDWLAPTLMGAEADNPAVFPYWLGAWAIQLAPTWVNADFAVRIPFAMLLALAMMTTWYGTYCLARNPLAQPVPFAFGGEAFPADYARALADGGVLALIACLGLAQLSHETTPAMAQLGFCSLFFYAMCALPYRRNVPALAVALGLTGLALSGAPSVAFLLGLGSAVVHFLDRGKHPTDTPQNPRIVQESVAIGLTSVAAASLALSLGLLRWKIELPSAVWAEWSGYMELLVWFTWPAWPMALWTLWRWRYQLFNRRISRHIVLPAWFILVCVVATMTDPRSPDRTLLLALPALAALAAFALPTLKRQVAALIDWFTILFFSTCALILWSHWLGMQTGFPAQTAANIARLAPGFEASSTPFALAIAATSTFAWAWLVKWRIGRHRAAIWKSLVLPAGGIALTWLLGTSILMPVLNYKLSYKALVQQTMLRLSATDCIETLGLRQDQIAAFQHYGNLRLRPLQTTPTCPWLLAGPLLDRSAPPGVSAFGWAILEVIQNRGNTDDIVFLYNRK